MFWYGDKINWNFWLVLYVNAQAVNLKFSKCSDSSELH